MRLPVDCANFVLALLYFDLSSFWNFSGFICGQWVRLLLNIVAIHFRRLHGDTGGGAVLCLRANHSTPTG